MLQALEQVQLLRCSVYPAHQGPRQGHNIPAPHSHRAVDILVGQPLHCNRPDTFEMVRFLRLIPVIP